MDNLKHAHLVPQQTKGIQKDIMHSVEAEDEEDAEFLFVDVKDRLLDINNWKQYSRHTNTDFQLTDSHGKEVDRHAHMGDYIRIDIPGPGPGAGGGNDWVLIEQIVYDDYPDEHIESIGMLVRPAPAPGTAADDVAHFFEHSATSTFILERRTSKVILTYYGRNETANDSTESITDNIRNAIVSFHARLGFSDAQWEDLVKGLLHVDDE